MHKRAIIYLSNQTTTMPLSPVLRVVIRFLVIRFW